MAESHDSVVSTTRDSKVTTHDSRHRRGKVGRILGVASVVIGLFLVGSSQIQVQNNTDNIAESQDRIKEEARLRQAQQCVAQYERVDQLRTLGAFIIRTNADTLLQVSQDTPNQTPEQQQVIQRFKELVEGDVKEAEEIVDVVSPCDLKAAKALLETEGANS